MKKLLLVAILALFSFSSANAQGSFDATFEVGIVTGDLSDFTSASLAAAITHLFDLSEKFKAGPSVGYTNYFGKDSYSDFGAIPILAKVTYSLSETIGLDAGAGYAIFTGDGDGGDFTWRIGLSWEVDSPWNITGGFNSITGDNSSIDTFFVGVQRSF